MDYLVTVIVPVYKVEKYIERCARALFEQTFRSIEYIFVDDLSPDDSMEIVRRVASWYPARRNAIRCVRHFKNRGVAAARNTGLHEANGDYIAFCDGDDWMEPDAIEKMYEAAVRTEADVVWTDFYYTYSGYEKVSVQKNKPVGMECIKALLCEKMHGGLWNKLVKRNLYEQYDICFLAGLNVWEYLRVCVQLFYYADKVAYLPGAFYHYVQYNASSVCSGNLLTGLHDAKGNVESIIAFLTQKGIYKELERQALCLKLAAKRNLLVTVNRYSFMRWKLIFPESNRAILRYRVLPLHLRLLGWCTAHGWWSVVNFWIFLKKRL